MDEEDRVIRVPLLITLLAADQDTHSSFLSPEQCSLQFWQVLRSLCILLPDIWWRGKGLHQHKIESLSVAKI